MWGLNFRSYDTALVLLGIAALIDMLLPFLTTVALISIIGIPLAIMLMALPALALVLIPARLLQRGLGMRGSISGVACIAATLLTLAAAAGFFNRNLDSQAATLVAGDIDVLPAFKIDTLAVASGSQSQIRERSSCDDLCLRLLVNGQVQKYTIFAYRDLKEGLPVTAKGLSYRLEKRTFCPDVDLQDGRLRIEADAKAAAPAADQMRTMIASGTCLFEEPAALADVPLLIISGNVQQGNTPFGAGLSPGADTVTADRLALFQRDGTDLVERYRNTEVTWYRHFPIMAPTIAAGYGLEMAPAFLRLAAYHNRERYAYRQSVAAEFVQARLGLNVAMKAAAPVDREQIIVAALGTAGPIPRASRLVIEDFYQDLTGRQEVSQREKELALRILADPRLAAPRASYAIAKLMAKDGSEANAGLAGILFAKLVATSHGLKEDDPSYLGYPVSYVDNAIRWLPDDAILPHRAEIEAVARDQAKRIRTPLTLQRLSIFGESAIPTFIYLVDEAVRIRAEQEDEGDGDLWKRPYVSALTGLCTLGPRGKPAIDMLLPRLIAGQRPPGQMFRWLQATTLLNIGASDVETERAIGGLRDDNDRQNFESIVKQVRSGKPRCNW